VPTICRLNGGVYGGSTDLALACDFRIGVDTARCSCRRRGSGCIITRAASSATCRGSASTTPKAVPDRAEDRRARDAADRLSHRDGAAEALDEEVDRLAAILAGNAPVAMRGMKRAINEFARGKLDEEAADRRHRDSMRSAEIKEGIKAFAEKRPPKFCGLLVHECHGIGNAGARGAVAVGLVGVVGKAERNAADHAAVVAETEMPADHAGMPRQRRLRDGAEPERLRRQHEIVT
jgi:hypothetical protein